MNITVTKENGKSYGRVLADGGDVVWVSPGYYTNQMALAAADCWIAFHGGESMDDKVTVDLNEVYTAAEKGTGIPREWSAEFVASRVAEAYSHGLTVELLDGAWGQRYIQISNGKGSAYGQFHIGAEFRDRAVAA